jgi:hypothetical protein
MKETKDAMLGFRYDGEKKDYLVKVHGKELPGMLRQLTDQLYLITLLTFESMKPKDEKILYYCHYCSKSYRLEYNYRRHEEECENKPI